MATRKECERGCVTFAYSTVNPIAIGRFTQVLRNGMTSAPLPGAVTTSTSCTVDTVFGFPLRQGLAGQTRSVGCSFCFFIQDIDEGL